MSAPQPRWIKIEPKAEPQAENLFDFAAIEYEKTETAEERFWKFHGANPWVYRELVRLARELTAAQRRRCRTPKIGIRLLVERLRWDWEINTTSFDGFKINDHVCPYYARLIMASEPDLANVFETRRTVEEGRRHV